MEIGEMRKVDRSGRTVLQEERSMWISEYEVAEEEEEASEQEEEEATADKTDVYPPLSEAPTNQQPAKLPPNFHKPNDAKLK